MACVKVGFLLIDSDGSILMYYGVKSQFIQVIFHF